MELLRGVADAQGPQALEHEHSEEGLCGLEQVLRSRSEPPGLVRYLVRSS